jgi:hypothetical protein
MNGADAPLNRQMIKGSHVAVKEWPAVVNIASPGFSYPKYISGRRR